MVPLVFIGLTSWTAYKGVQLGGNRCNQAEELRNNTALCENIRENSSISEIDNALIQIWKNCAIDPEKWYESGSHIISLSSVTFSIGLLTGSIYISSVICIIGSSCFFIASLTPIIKDEIIITFAELLHVNPALLLTIKDLTLNTFTELAKDYAPQSQITRFYTSLDSFATKKIEYDLTPNEEFKQQLLNKKDEILSLYKQEEYTPPKSLKQLFNIPPEAESIADPSTL